MPDICMCESKKCPISKTCCLHKDSGTVPNKFRQFYFVLGTPGGPSEDADCVFFTPAIQRTPPEMKDE